MYRWHVSATIVIWMFDHSKVLTILDQNLLNFFLLKWLSDINFFNDFLILFRVFKNCRAILSNVESSRSGKLKITEECNLLHFHKF